MEIKAYEDFKFEDELIGIDDVSVTYLRSTDSSGDDGEELVQSITISTRNNGCARFINIKTESWSIEDIDELVKLLEDFKKRAELCL